jgi:hypothetical protein
LPEGRPGASLDEASARRLASEAVARRFGLDAARGQLREISASPAKLEARTDWNFTFEDKTVAPLALGEARVEVGIAGDEVASVGRYVYIPEDWQRQQRAAGTRKLMLRIADALTIAGLLVSAAVIGVIAWSRGGYAARLFVAAAGLMLAVSIMKAGNAWPTALAGFSTAAPLPLQIGGMIGIGLIGLTLTSVLVGLALGDVPRRLTSSSRLGDQHAAQLGVAGGFVASAVAALAWALRTPVWARMPDVNGAGTLSPMLQAAIDPITSLLMASAVVLSAFLLVDRLTTAWTRRRTLGIIVLAVLGFLAGGTPAGIHAGGYLAGGALLAVVVVLAYATLLRFDLTMVPLMLATMTAIGAVVRGIGRPYPGALAGSLLGALLAMAVGWWWFRTLRKWGHSPLR